MILLLLISSIIIFGDFSNSLHEVNNVKNRSSKCKFLLKDRNLLIFE